MFKNKIKDLRMKNNYTQEELVNKIHIAVNRFPSRQMDFLIQLNKVWKCFVKSLMLKLVSY